MAAKEKDRNVIELWQTLSDEIDEITERIGVDRNAWINETLTRMIELLKGNERLTEVLNNRRTIPDELIEQAVSENDELLRRLS